jgi:hypothetical protein
MQPRMASESNRGTRRITVMKMRRGFPSWLPVVDELRTLDELDLETAIVLEASLVLAPHRLACSTRAEGQA